MLAPMRGMTASTGPTGPPSKNSSGVFLLMRMSNLRVSRTRTSCPRSSAARTSARVLYSSGCRDRITIRMGESRKRRATDEHGWNTDRNRIHAPIRVSSVFIRGPLVQHELPGRVHDELGGQGEPAEEHRDEHPGAVG